jgi:AmmeMemoRadiSam system protein A
MDKTEHHPLVKLAIEAIERYVKSGEIAAPPGELPPELKVRRGAFVSIKKSGRLRGCIGTIRPVRGNLAEEIIHNAVSAAAKDPRFDPVMQEELADLEVSVDVLTEPQPVKDTGELDPKRFGVIVSKGYQQGVLLPDIGVDTVEEQLRICRQKAGIGDDEETDIYKFEVVRYH